MGFSHITVHSTSPELDRHLRQASEERAAAVYAAWTAIRSGVSAVAGNLAGLVSRARRADRTSRALTALSDRQLRDIGVNRADIESVAEAVAAQGSPTGVTLEDLRRVGIVHAAGEKRPVAPLPPEDKRRRRPRPWTGKWAARHGTAYPSTATG